MRNINFSIQRSLILFGIVVGMLVFIPAKVDSAVKANYDIEIKAYQYNIYGCHGVSHGIPVLIRNRSIAKITSVPVISIDIKDTAWETLSVNIDPGDSAVVYLSDSINKPNTGSYLIRVILDTTDDNQSNNTANILYHFDRTPVPAYTVSSECYRDTTIFTNQTNTSGFNEVSYKWLFGTGDTAITTHARYRYEVTDTGLSETFQVALISIVNGCRDTTFKSATVNGLPDPSFTAETVGHELHISNQSTINPGYTYVWTFGDGNGSNEMTPFHIYDKAGTYTVCLTVVSDKGCESTTCHTVTYSAGIEAKEGDLAGIKLIPNPSSGIVKMAGVESFLADAEFRMIILSADGKEVFATNDHTEMDLGHLESGLYFVQVLSGDRSVSLPLIIQ